MINLLQIISREMTKKDSLFFLFGINIAGFTTYNVLFVGCKVYLSAGLLGALAIFACCCFFLYATSLTLVKVSIFSKANPFQIIVNYLGTKGANLYILAISIAFIGWLFYYLRFCIEFFKTHLPSQMPFLENISAENLGACFGLLFCLTVLKDFGLRVVGLILTPLLLFSMCMLPFFLDYSIPIDTSTPDSMFQTIDFNDLTTLSSNFVTFILITPILFRSTTSVKLIKKSLKIAYLFILPLFYAFGVFCGVLSPDHNVVTSIASQSGVGPVFLGIYIFLGMWIICSLNLYCGADILAQALSSKNRTPIIFFLGMFVSVFFNYSQRDFRFENSAFLGCLVVGILVIILTKTVDNNFKLTDESPQQQHGNYYALLISYTVGVLVLCDILILTGSLFFDMALAAFFSCIFFTRFPPKKLNFNSLTILKKKIMQNEKQTDD